ncbi:hypothetical protein HY522_03440 [bacterium]|nr:hypothetical protein [bacterium]
MSENPGGAVQLKAGAAAATIKPEEGMSVAAFSVGGKNVLYPEGMIDVNGKEKRRGGIPVLFPNAGKLDETQPEFNLPQHGFARDMRWETVSVAPDRTSAQFRLSVSRETRLKYPFDFDLRVQIDLGATSLAYFWTIQNPSAVPIPTAPGLHPYFAIPAGRRAEVRTNIMGFELQNYRLDDSLFFMPQRVDLDIPDLGRVRMTPGGEFLRQHSRLVVWSDRPDYLCVEPWAASLGSIFRSRDRLEVKPASEVRLTMKIELIGTA